MTCAALTLVVAAALQVDPRGSAGEPAAPDAYDAAIVAARMRTDPGERASASFDVLERAGDLPAAMDEGLRALAEGSGDRVLAWRVGGIAVALRDAGAARVAMVALQRLLRPAELDAAARDAWASAVAKREHETSALEALERERAAALSRARIAATLGLAACMAALVRLGAQHDRARR